jgi:hypothetical protein
MEKGVTSASVTAGKLVLNYGATNVASNQKDQTFL